MFPVKDAKDFLSGWIYKNGAETIPIPVEDMIQIRQPSPTDPYRGQSVIQSILADVERRAIRISME